MVCSSIILGLIKPICQMLHRVTMLFEIVLEYAFPGHVLNELDLRITGVREGDTNDPIPRLAHICTFVVLRDAVSVHKLLTPMIWVKNVSAVAISLTTQAT